LAKDLTDLNRKRRGNARGLCRGRLLSCNTYKRRPYTASLVCSIENHSRLGLTIFSKNRSVHGTQSASGQHCTSKHWGKDDGPSTAASLDERPRAASRSLLRSACFGRRRLGNVPHSVDRSPARRIQAIATDPRSRNLPLQSSLSQPIVLAVRRSLRPATSCKRLSKLCDRPGPWPSVYASGLSTFAR
jgi:hypothetical protein